MRYTDPSGHKPCEDETGKCLTPVHIPKCTADYCSKIPTEERASEEEAFRLFLEDPLHFAELWANPKVWYNDDTALHFRRYVENYLRQTPDRILLEGIAEAYGAEYAKSVDDLRQKYVWDSEGLPRENVSKSGILPPLPLISGEILYGTVSVPGGTYEYRAILEVQDRVLTLRNGAFFPVGNVPPPGPATLLALRAQLLEEARAFGMDYVRIVSERISGVNPGRVIDWIWAVPRSGGDRK